MTQCQDNFLIYDGECPFCSRYVALVRLRTAIGPVKLIDARDGGACVQSIEQAGYDLNEGMVLSLNGQFYHGADCIHRLALLTTGSGVFNRMNALVFKSEKLSRALYPIMRFGRNTTLMLLGRKKMATSQEIRPSE